MHLSRVQVVTEGLNRDRLIRLLSGDAYGNHQLLWQLFPEQKERPFLFRQELECDGYIDGPTARGLPLFYVLSTVEPVPVPDLLACASKAFAPRLRVGQKLAFRLRANPVVSRRDADRKNGQRHDVLMDAKAAARQEGISDRNEISARMDAAARDWLSERAERNGFELVTEPQIGAYQQHAQKRRKQEIRFSSVDYEGVLRLADPEVFKRMLFAGIGRSRAFGCGLMMIRPV